MNLRHLKLPSRAPGQAIDPKLTAFANHATGPMISALQQDYLSRGLM
jgi:hypothetical protein